MKKIILGLVFAAFACCSALAQSNVRIQAQVVATCGTQTLTAGVFIPVFQDTTGTLCTDGGWGGGAVTQGTTPWVDNITQWASTSLGAPTAWGVAPSGNVIGANVNVIASTPLTLTGNVGGYDFQIAPTITVDAGAYAAGDAVGGLVTITGAARTNGGSGAVNGVRLKSTGGSTNTIWVYAWSKTPVATCTNNNAFVPSASDNAFAIVGFPTSIVLGGAPGAWDTATYAQLSSMLANFKNQDASPGTAIYLCLVTAGAVTPAATTDLSMIVSGVQN